MITFAETIRFKLKMNKKIRENTVKYFAKNKLNSYMKSFKI